MTIAIGGGCKPKGITNQSKAFLERESERRVAELREKRRKWLESEEGKAHTAKILEQEAEEARRRAEAAELDRLVRAWGQRYDALRAQNPKTGTIVIAHTAYPIRVQQNPANGNLTAYALIQVEGVFPEEPYYSLVRGKKGLKVFLNGASREHLEKLNSDVFSEVRRNKEYFGFVESKHFIRIIGTAASGKSVHGEFV